jgi:hypothetical protein
MPLIPRHMLKVYADVQLTGAFGVDIDLMALSGVAARGNENGDHEAMASITWAPAALNRTGWSTWARGML